MIVRERSFPHPVLTPLRDDVVPNRFEFSVAETSDADNHYLQIIFNHENATITELVERGKAVYAVHVECRRTFYREVFRFTSWEYRLTLPATDLVGLVEISGFVLATETIGEYRIVGAHPDYGSATFPITPGDILAAGVSVRMDAFVDYDPLASVASILTITRSENDDEGAMEVDTDSDRITATLSQQDYDRYTNLKPDPAVAALLSNQVVVPALLEAVRRIKTASDDDDREEGMQLRWYRSVVRKLREGGLDIWSEHVSPLDAVQVLLNLPLRRSLEGILRLTADEETT